MACGNLPETAIDINRLEALGQALNAETNLSVFHGGFVGFSHESEVNNYVKAAAQRSAARPWPGQRTAKRAWRRSTGQANRFRSDAIEEAFGAEFRVLARNYPALGLEDQDGLWVVAESMPLGRNGPQIHFLIAFHLDRSVVPRAWAFDRVGPQARLMPLKHTNFPDASICAFLPNDGSWSSSDGMLPLVDHYSVWTVKSLHRTEIGYWPGRQYGACAHYRRKEFKPEESCGCLSGKRYKDCHQAADILVAPPWGQQEFRRLFGCDYETRAVPVALINAARSRWKSMPAIAAILQQR